MRNTAAAAAATTTLATTRRGFQLLDRLALLDPRTWWGCFRIVHAFLPLDATLLVETVARVFVPAVLLLLLTVSSSTVTMVALLSPWSVGSMSRIVPHISKQLNVVHGWKIHRSSPLPEALACLQDRIDRQQAYRTRGYDIYYPPQKNSINENVSCHALLILPGALIDHRAYSEIATRLADAGILVVVLNLEPLRLASPFLRRTNTKSLVRLTRQLSNPHHHPHYRHPGYSIRTWSVAGHSFGGFRIAELIAESAVNKDAPLPFQNYVFWASPAVHHLLAAASPSEKQRIRLLSIQGEQDPTRFLMRRGEEDNLRAVLEAFPHSCEVILQGACHSQFGSYHVAHHTHDPHHWSHRDIATISRQEQLNQIGNLTVDFLNNQ